MIREGPAFPLPVRLFATALVATMLAWGLRAAPALAASEWTASALALAAGALAMVLWCLFWIWRSRTRVDAEGIVQTWLWDKRVRWADVAQARLVGVPHLEWLIAPRFVARVRGGSVAMFHAADPRVLEVLANFVATGRKLESGAC